MWIYIIVAFVGGAIGFSTCAILTIGHNADAASEAYINKKEHDPLDSIEGKL